MPALDPKPMTTSTKAVLRTQAGKCAEVAAIAANDWLPACVAKSTRPTSSAAAPNWVITAYHWAATCTSDRRR